MYLKNNQRGGKMGLIHEIFKSFQRENLQNIKSQIKNTLTSKSVLTFKMFDEQVKDCLLLRCLN